MKVETGFWSLGQDNVSRLLFYLLTLFLPTQFGKHFITNFSFAKGIRIDYLSPTLYFTDILILIIFLFSIKKVLQILINKYKKNFFLYLLFLLFLLVGIFSSKNYLAGLYVFIKFIEFSYLGVYAVINLKTLSKNVLATCFGLGIISESLLAIFQYLNQGSFQGIFYFFGERTFNGQTPGIANASINGALVLRPYATFSHPNVLAGYLNLAVIFYLYFLKQPITKIRLIVILIAAFGALVSLSRVGILIFLISVGIFFCITIFEKYKKGKSNPRYFIYALMAGFFIAFVYFIFENNSLFVQRFLGLRLNDESVLQRGLLVKEALEMFFKNPVFGVGLGNFIPNLGKTFLAPGQLQPVHNIFLLILAETGFVGLISFIFLFKKIISKTKNIYFLMVIISLIALGGFDHYLLTLQQGQLLFVLAVATIMSEKG